MVKSWVSHTGSKPVILRIESGLTRTEQQTLRCAKYRGWITLTSQIGDDALERWRQECQKTRRAFAIARPEAKRTSIWFVLPEERRWSSVERELASRPLGGATGVIFNENSVRAFVAPGREDQLISCLLTATSRTTVLS